MSHDCRPMMSRCCPQCGGATLGLKSNQVAEDAVETWVQCSCGARGECVEDAFADPAGAVAQWNRYPVEPAPLTNDNAPAPLACTLVERDAECARMVMVGFQRAPTAAELAHIRAAMAAIGAA